LIRSDGVEVDEYGMPIVDEDTLVGTKKRKRSSSTTEMTRPKSQEEILWSEYGIKPNLPIRTKIEHLTIVWRLTPHEICTLLQLPSDEFVENELDKLTKEWQELGKPPTEESQEILRGKTIADLLRLKAEIETASNGIVDSRLLTLKIQVIDKLSKLQGVEFDRREREPEEDIIRPVENALKALSPEQLLELYNKIAD